MSVSAGTGTTTGTGETSEEATGEWQSILADPPAGARHRAGSGDGSPNDPNDPDGPAGPGDGPDGPATDTGPSRGVVLTRVAPLTLLATTAVLYLWGLDANGYANSYYAAAVQAGATDWTAFLFGSLDGAGGISVDKPPASLWLSALAVRLFGLSSWAVLVPHALVGVATVALLYAGVRRHRGPVAGLVAGAVCALTPVAALMFRYNNPDALLVLLTTAAAYAVLRALERGRLGWLLLAGALLGLGFLTKQLQVFLVLPALGLTYLVAAPVGWLRRVWQLLAAGGVMVVAAGWWVALVELVPARLRPYVGGSQTNSFLELTFGYNGLGRVFGQEPGGVSVPAGASGQGAITMSQNGLGRLFEGINASQIGWLLPAAMVLLVVGLWLRRRAPRTDLPRAQLLLWGGYLVVTALTLSLMSGIYHEYYTVAMAPAIGGLVGVGGVLLWRQRRAGWARAVLAVVLLGTLVWAFVLLGRVPDWLPGLRWGLLAAAVVLAAGLVVVWRLPARAQAALGGATLAAAVAAPAAYAVDTATYAYGGPIVLAGPQPPMDLADMLPPGALSGGQPGGAPGAPGGQPGGVPGGAPGGMPPGGLSLGGDGRIGTAGGFLDSEASPEVTQLLAADADSYTWVATSVAWQQPALYQLATEEPVLALGGFSGTDPYPTLADFQALVADGEVHYFIESSGFGPAGMAGGVRGPAQEIADWVADTYEPIQVAGVTLYDLTPAG